MSGHTPGPWFVAKHSSEMVCTQVDGKGTVVALAYGNDLADETANARLIAAAPCLLAACESLLASTSVAGYKAAREAVAKAKGGASDE